MHVQFEFTQEDLIDVSRRSLDRSKAVRSWRLKGLLYSVISCGGAAFLPLFLMGRPVEGAIVGLIAAVVMGFLYPGWNRSNTEKRLRRLVEEKIGDKGPFLCEVEISPVGVWVRQLNTQVTHEWESVESIEETADSVDIITRGGSVVVRNRAFNSAEERSRFIELAQGYLELASAGRADHDEQLIDE
jgi:hypothetical protein